MRNERAEIDDWQGETVERVSELEGSNLDYWAARAEGYFDGPADMLEVEGSGLEFSTDWSLGGPIIERERIGLQHLSDGWFAGVCKATAIGMKDGRGPTHSLQ